MFCALFLLLKLIIVNWLKEHKENVYSLLNFENICLCCRSRILKLRTTFMNYCIEKFWFEIWATYVICFGTFLKIKKIQHYKGTFFLIFFFNTYYFFIRHNFMYLAQYNTFCSKKKKSVCVCGEGVVILMNYLIFGKFMIIQISVRKNVHFMNFSLLFIVFTDVVFEEIRKRQCTKMYTTLHK